MSSSRPRNYKCQTCEKSYIGQAGLGRHYRLNPSHGTLPEDAGQTDEKANGVTVGTENTPVLKNGSGTSTPSGVSASTVTHSFVSSTGNISEDSNTQDSIPSSSGAISPITTRTPRRGRGSFRGRGRWAVHHPTAPARRKQKLKELVKTVEDDDLMEVVLPRLAKFVTLWEFMLMKIETCSGTHPRVDHIYREYLALHKHVKQACHEGVQYKQDTGQENGLNGEESREGNPDILKLEDEAIARSLGLTAGSYEIKDLPVNEYTSFRYKYLTSDPNGPPGVSAEKRTIQVVTPDELVSLSPSKRNRVTSLLHSSSSTPATVTFTPSAAAASSLLTSIVTNSGLKGTVSKQQPTQNLFRTVAIQQPQTSMLQTVTIQQPHSNLLQSVAVQQPQSVMRTMSMQPQQQTTAVLRTVCMPSQDQPPTVLRAVTVQGQSHPPQASLLCPVQQPVIASPNKLHSRPAVMGVSLLNTSSSSISSQQPSVTVLKTAPGQTPRVLVAATVSSSVTGPCCSVFQQSQAAQVVSVLPTNVTTASLSFLQQTPGCAASGITHVAPDDFLDTSGDSLMSSVSGLSSANSSGLVTSINSSLPNGEMAELGFTSVVKLNGASESSKPGCVLGEKEQTPVVSTTTPMQVNSEQLSVTSAMQSASSVASLFIKCENGEQYTVASTVEPLQLVSTTVSTVLATATDAATTVPAVNGQFTSAQVEVEKEDGEEQTMLLTGGSVTTEEISRDDLLGDGEEASMEVEESAEGPSFTLHQNATLFQTEDGTVILQNPDGTTFQLQGVGDQGLTLESVQELLSQMVSGDQVQAELQQ